MSYLLSDMLPNSPKKRIKNKVWELYLLYPFSLASRIAYGTDKIAAMGIALKANMVTALILVGFAFGGQPLVGYNYGSRNRSRLKEILKFGYLFEMGLDCSLR